eukprot:2775639-Prorocentrum_lima.AAC.1
MALQTIQQRFDTLPSVPESLYDRINIEGYPILPYDETRRICSAIFMDGNDRYHHEPLVPDDAHTKGIDPCVMYGVLFQCGLLTTAREGPKVQPYGRNRGCRLSSAGWAHVSDMCNVNPQLTVGAIMQILKGQDPEG